MVWAAAAGLLARSAAGAAASRLGKKVIQKATPIAVTAFNRVRSSFKGDNKSKLKKAIPIVGGIGGALASDSPVLGAVSTTALLGGGIGASISAVGTGLAVSGVKKAFTPKERKSKEVRIQPIDDAFTPTTSPPNTAPDKVTTLPIEASADNVYTKAKQKVADILTSPATATTLLTAGAAGAGYALGKANSGEGNKKRTSSRKKSSNQSKRSRKAKSSRGTPRRAKRTSKGKGKQTSMKKLYNDPPGPSKSYGTEAQYKKKGGKDVKYTKTGQPYIILANGKARFLKKSER